MFNFGKKKPNQIQPPVTIHLDNARKRAEPTPITLHSTDLIGLLKEAVELGKLKATESRDLEAIRTDYMKTYKELDDYHNRAMSALDQEYAKRNKMIDEISAMAKQLISQGQYEAGQAIISQMLDIIAKQDSPLNTVIQGQSRRSI